MSSENESPSGRRTQLEKEMLLLDMMPDSENADLRECKKILEDLSTYGHQLQDLQVEILTINCELSSAVVKFGTIRRKFLSLKY